MSVPGEGPEITLAPIPVTSRDEVGQLAAAFNSVNSTTVQVAQEQAALRGSIAEMFVNVARRDQVLLNRQLSFIDSLERAEEDPSTLANLFRLDHLATRMRRNAESLLVLAGIDSGRRLRDAMPLSDVVRTASSEIEQYDRVELDLQVDPHMHGFNALGAAHMLAELLENATIFSEPETPVTVTTGVSGQFVVVRILDQGLGMSDAELEAANAKIVSTSASDSLGNQRLGLFVVGRIAQRLGADVRLLKAAHGTGTETIVRFPATLFVMTETNLYGNGAPAALAAPRNDPGLPQIEAPVVEEVDLAALTDGQTSLGLPHRRRRDDGSDESVGPIPVTELPQSTGLPTRSKKTFDEDNLVLPEAPDGQISAEISAAGSDWKPATVAPLKGGLPSRSRASTSAWAKPEEPAAAAAAAATPAPAPAARAGLFSGFRGRSETARRWTPARTSSCPAWCLTTASARSCPPSPTPCVPRGCRAVLTQRPPSRWSSRSSRTTTTRGRRRRPRTARRRTPRPPPRWWPQTQAAQAEAAPVLEEAPAWEPTPAWDAAQAEAPAWQAPAVAETPAWDAPAAEAVAAEAPAWEAPAAEVPAWEAPAAETPAWEAPAEETPALGSACRRRPRLGGLRPTAETPGWDEPVAARHPPGTTRPLPRRAPSGTSPSLSRPLPGSPRLSRLPPGTRPTPPRPRRGRRPPPPRPGGTRRPSTTSPPGRRLSPPRTLPPPDVALRHAGAEAGGRRPAAPAAAAPVAPAQAFTSYSGYAGWGAPASDVSAVPAVRAHARRGSRLAHRCHADRPGGSRRGARAGRARRDSSDEPAPATDDAAWPAPAWEPPTWQAPEWAEQPAEAAAEVPSRSSSPSSVVECRAPSPPSSTASRSSRVYLEAADVDEPSPSAAEVAPTSHPSPSPEAPQWAAPVQEAAPAWPTFQAPHQQVEAPTQLFTPVEAAAAVEPEPAPQAPVHQEAPVAYAAPEAPVWAPTAPAQAAPAPRHAGSESPTESPRSRTTPRVAASGACSGGRRVTTALPDVSGPVPVQSEPAPVSQVAPVRTSAWTAESAAPQSPTGADSSQSWMASTTWSAPAAPAPHAPASLEPVSAGSWAPPEWAARPGANAAPSSTVPQPALPPSVAPRVGTLDDEVAAMLALRSDIQEQALSELSQLSAYRPAATGGNAERLTKRVPTAVPATTVSRGRREACAA